MLAQSSAGGDRSKNLVSWSFQSQIFQLQKRQKSNLNFRQIGFAFLVFRFQNLRLAWYIPGKERLNLSDCLYKVFTSKDQHFKKYILLRILIFISLFLERYLNLLNGGGVGGNGSDDMERVASRPQPEYTPTPIHMRQHPIPNLSWNRDYINKICNKNRSPKSIVIMQ